MFAHRPIFSPPQDFKVQPAKVIEQNGSVAPELLELAIVASILPFSPYPMDWNIKSRQKGIGKNPKPKPMPKPKPEIVLEVYPPRNVRDGWFCLFIGNVDGKTFRARWFKSNSTEELDTDYPKPVLINKRSVKRRVR
jgi:hypothetical protein